MLLLDHSDTRIGERLAAELTGLEGRFADELASELSCVNSLVRHVERYRGKMFRPMLVLVAGMAGSRTGDQVGEAHRVIATVVEMVHMATLVHDDVLDEAQVRRGGATLNHFKGNEAAVMLGDYLISHAYHLCSTLGRTEVSRIIAEATNTVCEGELLQLANRDNPALDEQTYFQIIQRKTASLCGACCRLGAMLNGAEPVLVEGLYKYGVKLGMAFQVVDDLLDLVGAEGTVGKTLGRDLQKGKLTLPMIRCLSTAGEDQRRRLLELAGLPRRGQAGMAVLEPDRVVQVRRLLDENGAVDYASRWARRLVGQAKDALAGVVESPVRSVMVSMAEAVLTRNF